MIDSVARRRALPAWLLLAVGVLLLGAVAWHVATTHLWVMAAETDANRFALQLAELVLMTAPPVGLLYAAARLQEREGPRGLEWRILLWTLGGVAGVVGVIAAIAVHRAMLGVPLETSLLEMELLTGAGVGSLLGFGVGRQSAAADRRAATIEEQRDAFAFLNRLLRHHVLNSVQVIDGTAGRLADRDDPELAEIGDVVRTRCRDVTDLVRNVQTVVATFTADRQREQIDLAAVVAAECATAREQYESATVDLDAPAAVHVASSDLLAVVVRNLLDNAVQHSDRAAPAIEVTLEAADGTARLRISDDGPGIPADEVDAFLEPGEVGDRGMGLYLANRFVTQLGGSLEIDANKPRGTVVTIELPTATARTDETRGAGA